MQLVLVLQNRDSKMTLNSMPCKLSNAAISHLPSFVPLSLSSRSFASKSCHFCSAQVSFAMASVLVTVFSNRKHIRRCSSIAASASVSTRGSRFRTLGSSSLQVTDVCLGTMTWGIQNTEEDAHAQMDYAIKERGLNFLDTAEMYPVPSSDKSWKAGRTEEMLGTWLAKNKALRQSVVLATKVSGYSTSSSVVANRSVPPGPKATARLDAHSINEACEASLRRLQTDYIDLYQLHWPDRYVPMFGPRAYDPSMERADKITFNETVSAIHDLIKAGKVRQWGISNETSFGVCEYARACREVGVPMPVSVQNEFSLLSRSFESELAECCAPSNNNIGLLPWSPLCGGVLTGKYLGKIPPNSRFALFPQFQGRYTTPAVLEAVRRYQKLADEHGMSLAALALQWCQSRWYVTSTIVGATTLQQLKHDIDAFDVYITQGLQETVLKQIDAIHSEISNPTEITRLTTLPSVPGVPGRM